MGDRVDLGGGMTGEVVILFAEAACAAGYRWEDWAYLARGCLVRSPQAGLIHYEDAGSGEPALVARGAAPDGAEAAAGEAAGPP